jgi:hypothetical protein
LLALFGHLTAIALLPGRAGSGPDHSYKKRHKSYKKGRAAPIVARAAPVARCPGNALRHQERMMLNENIPIAPSPEQPPLAPHDPPEPAPQAAAWRRALRVIGHIPPKEYRIGRSSIVKTSFRKG